MKMVDFSSFRSPFLKRFPPFLIFVVILFTNQRVVGLSSASFIPYREEIHSVVTVDEMSSALAKKKFGH